MKQSLIFFGAIVFASFIFSACGNKNTEGQNTADSGNAENNKMKSEQELRDANDQFYVALNIMFTGNIEPMNAIWSHGEDVTIMSPFGGRLESWDVVGAEFKKEASMKLGGKVICKDLLVHAGTDMGYTVCIEEGENMSADGKPVPVHFRATNIFRLENSQWKMVHHHTDISSALQEAVKAEAK